MVTTITHLSANVRGHLVKHYIEYHWSFMNKRTFRFPNIRQKKLISWEKGEGGYCKKRKVHYISALLLQNNSKVIFSQTNTNTLYMYT